MGSLLIENIYSYFGALEQCELLAISGDEHYKKRELCYCLHLLEKPKQRYKFHWMEKDGGKNDSAIVLFGVFFCLFSSSSELWHQTFFAGRGILGDLWCSWRLKVANKPWRLSPNGQWSLIRRREVRGSFWKDNHLRNIAIKFLHQLLLRHEEMMQKEWRWKWKMYYISWWCS